jgi:tRNA A37 methylthiotransferase MiaB
VPILVEGPSKVQQKQRRHSHAPVSGQTLDGHAPGNSAALAEGEEAATMQLTGRTTCDRIVVFEGGRQLVGRMVNVVVYEATAFTLFGVLAPPPAAPDVYVL